MSRTLRERGDDIVLLAETFLKSAGAPISLTDEAREALLHHTWPGKVRELQNAMQRAAVVCGDNRIRREDLPQKILAHTVPTGEAEEPIAGSMKDMERSMLEAALQRSGGNVNEVVEKLGIGRTTVYRKLKKYGLR